MINLNLRKELPEKCIVFDNPSFDNSIIGITEDECHVIYDYEKMLIEFSEENNCDSLTAADFIDYNTLRSISYIN